MCSPHVQGTSGTKDVCMGVWSSICNVLSSVCNVLSSVCSVLSSVCMGVLSSICNVLSSVCIYTQTPSLSATNSHNTPFQMLFEAGMAKNTYGTGAFLLMNSGTEPIPSQFGLLTTMLYQAWLYLVHASITPEHVYVGLVRAPPASPARHCPDQHL